MKDDKNKEVKNSDATKLTYEKPELKCVETTKASAMYNVCTAGCA